MEFSVRRFARNILLAHLALLVIVLVIVLFASRQIEEGARTQALGQAQRRQEQLANQTARGIEGFYQNILSDMDLLPRNDDSQPERSALSEGLLKAAPKTPQGGPLGQRGVLVGFLLARQLEDRVSHLFVVDQRDMVPHALLREDLQEELNLGRSKPTTHPAVRTNKSGQPRSPNDKKLRPSPPVPTKAELEVVEKNEDWLKSVTAQAISKFELLDDGGVNLVALPLFPLVPQGNGGGPIGPVEPGGRNREFDRPVFEERAGSGGPGNGGSPGNPVGPMMRPPMQTGPSTTRPAAHVLVVAAVPVEKINEKYLSRLNSDPNTGTFLIDESMIAMAASRPGLVGMDFDAAGDENVKALFADFRQGGYQGMSRPIRQPFKIGDHKFDAAIVTAEPIEVMPGRKWFLVVASPLSDVDRIVSLVFGRVVLWAVFVIIAVTGILVSTATQLIRGRAKLERVRMDVLRKELERARMIQQAWLPRDPPASSSLDVAAVNYPAQHISGDFYNWFDLPDGRTAISIGDVTGHGMSAAFLMATTQLLVRMTMQRITDPGRCLTEVNRQLCAQVFNGQFVTMLLMIMDPETGAIEMANAGHPAPLLVKGRGTETLVPLPIDSQLVLGVEPDAAYQTERMDLGSGATLLLYTDGAPDVMSSDGRRFGNDGLKAAVPLRGPDGRLLDARGLVDAVVHAVNRFRGRTELSDDLTLVAIRLTAPAPKHEPEAVAALP